MKYTFTIFTPTYNRGHLLEIVFSSLLSQSYQNFEWVIVDDGSTDDTDEIVNHLKLKSNFPIKYLKQQNKGKHIAINRGVEIAEGIMVVLLDSDDRLPSDSLQIIFNKYQQNKDRNNFGGVAGRKAYFNGRIVGSETPFDEIYTNSIDYRHKYKIIGDIAEVFLTHVLKEFTFPETAGEKFCPEALVWNRIAQKYNLLFFSEIIYECEYLPDGLTSKIVKIRMNSPIASMMFYSELEKCKIQFIQKIKANINYWRFSLNASSGFKEKLRRISKIYTIIGLLPGILMYMNDKKNNQ